MAGKTWIWLALCGLVAAMLVPAAAAGAQDGSVDDEKPSWVELLGGDLSWPGGAPARSDESPTTRVDRDEPPVSAGEPSGSGDVSAAVTFVVTTTSDVVNGADGVLSLREAMTLANSDAADSIIQLMPDEFYSLTSCGPDPAEEDANANGDLDHTDTNALTIIGGSGLSPTSTDIAGISTTCQESILDSTTSAVVTLNGLALENADARVNTGGAVQSSGTVIVNDSIFTNNQTSEFGGAIYASGGITAHRSIFDFNIADSTGGGALDSSGSVDVTNSLFFANESVWAAAIYASDAATVTASTIFVNDSGAGGDVRGSIITSTTSFIGLSEGVAPACSTPVTNSGGYNLFTDTSCGTGVSTDTVSVGADGDDLFADLVSVRPGGLLHDVVPAAKCAALDLFSAPRPQGERCEIGAFELPWFTVPTIAKATDTLTPVVIADVLAGAVGETGSDPADLTTLRVKTTPTKGTAVLAGQKLTYTPGQVFDGVDNFSLEVCDAVGVDCAVIPVMITIDGLTSKWFFTNALQGGAASATTVFGKGVGDEFFVGDFDGDGVDDLAKRSRGSNVFTIRDLDGVATAADTVVGYGKPGDQVLVGDWDGNGTDTFAVRRGNQFFVKNSVTPGPADVVIGYGKAGDEVFVGDWDRDGDDTFAVRRGNVFYARNSVTTGVADEVFGYGKAADRVLVGDWDANGSDTFAVRRGNVIFVRNDFLTAPAEFSFGFGKASDELFPGDWNNDNLDTFAVRRIE